MNFCQLLSLSNNFLLIFRLNLLQGSASMNHSLNHWLRPRLTHTQLAFMVFFQFQSTSINFIKLYQPLSTHFNTIKHILNYMADDWWWLVTAWQMTDDHQQHSLSMIGKQQITDEDWWWTVLYLPSSTPVDSWQMINKRWQMITDPSSTTEDRSHMTCDCWLLMKTDPSSTFINHTWPPHVNSFGTGSAFVVITCLYDILT